MSPGLEAAVPYILLVDDDEDVRDVVRELLVEEGYEVLAKGDGQAALDHLRTARPLPFLIVSDMQMPRLKGDELIAELLADPDLAEVPVIIITANALRPLRLQGASFVVPKPIDPTVLLGAIEETLRDATESQRVRARRRVTSIL